MYPKDADIMVKSVGPDQTAHLGAVWSRPTLFAQTYLAIYLFMIHNPAHGVLVCKVKSNDSAE